MLRVHLIMRWDYLLMRRRIYLGMRLDPCWNSQWNISVRRYWNLNRRQLVVDCTWGGYFGWFVSCWGWCWVSWIEEWLLVWWYRLDLRAELYVKNTFAVLLSAASMMVVMVLLVPLGPIPVLMKSESTLGVDCPALSAVAVVSGLGVINCEVL